MAAALTLLLMLDASRLATLWRLSAVLVPVLAVTTPLVSVTTPPLSVIEALLMVIDVAPVEAPMAMVP